MLNLIGIIVFFFVLIIFIISSIIQAARRQEEEFMQQKIEYIDFDNIEEVMFYRNYYILGQLKSHLPNMYSTKMAMLNEAFGEREQIEIRVYKILYKSGEIREVEINMYKEYLLYLEIEKYVNPFKYRRKRISNKNNKKRKYVRRKKKISSDL